MTVGQGGYVAIRFLILLMLFAGLSAARSTGVVTSGFGEPPQAVNPQPMEQFTLSTSLISRRFCSADDEVAVMQAKVRLQYHNKGPQPIILSKSSVGVESLIISRTSADAIAGKHENIADFDTVPAEGPQIAAQDYNAEFVVISAGESYYVETMAPVVFSLTSKAVAGAVTPGQHVLQVVIGTFPSGGRLRDYAEQLARQKGYSWRNYVVSSPMTFAIESTPKLEACN